MAKISEIVAYLDGVRKRTGKDNPEIKIRDLERALEWPDLIVRFACSEDDDPDCYCE